MQFSKRRIASDFILSFTGVALMNAVLQLWFYPQMNRIYGPAMMGKILFLISVMSVFVIAFGTALDNSRLVTRFRFKTTNGDYNLLLILLSGISLAVCLPVTWYVFPSLPLWECALWVVLTLMRYYSAVEFRLRINCTGYFLYHALLAAGYGLGTWLMFHGFSWVFAFCLGEILALLYVILCGKIYRAPWGKSANFLQASRSVTLLSGAGLLSQGGQNLDRIILPTLIGALANTQFYVVSLLGKTLAMLVVPLNSVLISYLSKDAEKISRKTFIRITLYVTLISGIFFGICCIVTPIFLRIFYPDIYPTVTDLVVVAVLGQILCFASMVLLTAVLTFSEESLQLKLQILYITAFLILVFPLTYHLSLYGFALSVLISNFLRFIATILLGLKKIR